MRYIILSVVLGLMVTSNAAAADTCSALPAVWRITPGIVRMTVINGLNKMYHKSPIPPDEETAMYHGCMLSKVDFFVDSIIMHCNLGLKSGDAEQTAFTATLNLCVGELGYD